MSNASSVRIQHMRSQFDQNVRKGVLKASKYILDVSLKCATQVQDGPIGPLAQNVNNTIHTFISDKSDGNLMRFSLMSEPIINIVVAERSKTFSSLDSPKKLRNVAEAFGFMIGVSVLSAVTKIFLLQAGDKLKTREDLSEDAKKLCIEYITDVFQVILMSLMDELDIAYKTPQREKDFFANLLTENNWKTLIPSLDEPSQESITE